MKKIITIFLCVCAGLISNAAFGQSQDQTSNRLNDEYYYYEDELQPSEFILVDGQPVRLQNGLNLRDKDLSGVHIHNRTLSNIDFTGANFKHANLAQTRFRQCSFRDTQLVEVEVEDATFDGCDFENATVSNTNGIKLTRKQFLSLRHIKFKELFDFMFRGDVIDIKDIDYSNFRFGEVFLLNAEGCCFDNAEFFDNCKVLKMTKEQLISTKNYKERTFPKWFCLENSFRNEKISLSGLDLSHFRINGLTVRNYDLSNVDFTNVTIDGKLSFESCSGLTKEQLQSTTNWKNCNFNFCLYGEDIDWSNVDFSNFTFYTGACLGGGDVRGANFTNAKFADWRALQESKGLTLEQIQSTWNWKNRRFDFNLEGSVIDWSNVDFSNFTFGFFANLGKGNVTSANFTNAKWTVSSYARHYYLNDCKGLTLEQVKSTWNYKTGNMSVMILPPEIHKQLNDEAKAKGKADAKPSRQGLN